MVSSTGIEPVTYALGGRCNIRYATRTYTQDCTLVFIINKSQQNYYSRTNI